MLGPYELGSTAIRDSVWEIFYRLNKLIEWGTKEFKKWFDDNVIDWAKRRVKEVEADSEEAGEDGEDGDEDDDLA